ncbi:MAG: hypothetical protein KDE52_10105 [Calditrichaeota bacterium]|nr:hypothetical protein [Calditrichota bacterium]MCB0269821.1 hypothetical protein [Calditrichota bacterium]MCB0285125.1 hypothetical protein [Calditrichota bacterium]MCB0300398.1 hypothetical protein [Calditrichota bacterium]MCB9066798.1 hypothetical protein [Calditrichia bacterium]
MVHFRQTYLLGQPAAKEPKSGEDFFSMPRGEQLLAKATPAAGVLEKWIVNRRVSVDDRFTLEANDNRMLDAGIKKGDYVVVKCEKNYRDGELIAAQLGERILIRRFFRVAQRIRLECSNPDRQSMILDEKTPGFQMLGSVVQVIKEF